MQPRSLLAAAVLAALSVTFRQTPLDPLPDERQFLRGAKQNVTYSFTFTLAPHHPEDFLWNFRVFYNRLDSSGRLKKTTYREWGEVVEMADGRHVNRILGSEPPSTKPERQNQPVRGFRELASRPSSRKVRDEIWEHTRFKLLRRETVDDRPTLVFAFHTGGRLDRSILKRPIAGQNVEGELWFDEEDKVLMQVRGFLLKDFANAQKGSHWVIRLTRKGNSWLPLLADWRYKRPSGLFSSEFEQILSEFYDHRQVLE